jgi:nitrogen regulatory protein PII
MTNNYSLPFEIMGEKDEGKSNMKRVALLVKPEHLDKVIGAIRGLRIEAVIYDVKSAGKEKEKVSSGRGMGTVELAYVPRKLIVSIVDAEAVSSMVDAIRKVMGGKGSGLILTVAPVDGTVKI